MHNRMLDAAMGVLVLTLLLSTGLLYRQEKAAAGVGAAAAPAAVLIDPGHGGEDGGAAAADGTLEKNLNLAISLKLRDMLALWGFPVAMTRETDISIYDAGATTARQMKVSDMKNRLALYEQAATVISIHENHFSVPKYAGAQVFYSGNHPDSVRLAEAIRTQILTGIQPDNRRELKKATDGIFLLYHTKTPAVLVECGFLSNPAESASLKEPAYQQKMAFAVCLGFLDYSAAEPTGG